MALVSVGAGHAMVIDGPPMSSWGKSADDLVEVYYLEAWANSDLDSLINSATAALPTTSLRDTGKRLKLLAPDAFLLFAGDTPTSASYAVHRVPLAAGEYRILEGTYKKAGDSVTVYRLQPIAP